MKEDKRVSFMVHLAALERVTGHRLGEIMRMEPGTKGMLVPDRCLVPQLIVRGVLAEGFRLALFHRASSLEFTVSTSLMESMTPKGGQKACNDALNSEIEAIYRGTHHWTGEIEDLLDEITTYSAWESPILRAYAKILT